MTYRLIQNGIDLYDVSLGNGVLATVWGLGNGRKWPILFAGILLNDAKLKSPPYQVESQPSRTGTVEKFGEDSGTWYGKVTEEYPKGKPSGATMFPIGTVFWRFKELGNQGQW
jgi:hypothetical protein